MKKRVIEHFGGRVTVTEFNGKHNVITFKSNADAIMHFTEEMEQMIVNQKKE